MKKYLFLVLSVSLFLFISCKKDNNNGPKITDGNYFYFTATEAGSEISMVSKSQISGRTPNYTVSLQYQVNGTSDKGWSDFTPDATTVTLENVGDKVYFRANEDNSHIGENITYYKFATNDKKVNVGGNILYLLSKTPTTGQMKSEYSFARLFEECNIVDASQLVMPDNTVYGCYRGMFVDCIHLTKYPTLPATTLAEHCYGSMFSGCSSLRTAPDLPATTLATDCYRAMFSGCTALTTAPELPATTMNTHSYYAMFANCTSLTTAPALPATTLAIHCYQEMFSGCTSLTTAPDLPAHKIESYCYEGMFENCTSLTSAVLPAASITDLCYWVMFKGCSRLQTVTMKATTITNHPLADWLEDAGNSSSVLIVDNSITTSHEAWQNININTPSKWTIKTENGTVLRKSK